MDKTVIIGAGNPGMAIGSAMALIMAAKFAKSRPPPPLTEAQLAERVAQRERAEWNAEVAAKKAEKLARKADRR